MTHEPAGRYISIPVSGGEAEAYVVGSPDRPGVLFYMDAIGLRPQLEKMADRIASWGYTVLVPNVFWRDGRAADLAPTVDLRIPENRAEYMTGAMARVGALTSDLALADLPAWVQALRDHSDASAKFGTTGYCMGGRLSLRTAAAAPDDVAVAGMFHAGGIVVDAPDSPHLSVPAIRAHVVAGFADQDLSATPEQVEVFQQALESAGIEHVSAIYPDAPHGYSMEDTASYQEAGAERHFTELRDALSAALPAATEVRA